MQEVNQISKKIKNLANIVNNYIDENLTGETVNIWDAAKHYISAGGKRLRPFLVIKCYNLFENDSERAIPVAAAAELFHTFTLIHDDIMDKDAIRRGVTSVHKKWGEPIAILAGDLLYALSFIFINQALIPDRAKSKISYVLGKACIELCEGQTMDLDFENRNDVKIPEYMEMVRLKTGSLFKGCAYIGGLCGNANYEQLRSLEDYAENLGIAFQMVDDILGLFGDQGKLGKPVGSDLHAGKKTYLILHALGHLSQSDKNWLLKLLEQKGKSQEEIEECVALIEKSGAAAKAKDLAQFYVEEAVKSLSIFPKSEARKDLESLAYLTVERNF